MYSLYLQSVPLGGHSVAHWVQYEVCVIAYAFMMKPIFFRPACYHGQRACWSKFLIVHSDELPNVDQDCNEFSPKQTSNNRAGPDPDQSHGSR